MQTENRKRIESRIAAQDAFNRKSDRLIERLRAAEITVEQYEALLEEARETLEESLEALKS